MYTFGSHENLPEQNLKNDWEVLPKHTDFSIYLTQSLENHFILPVVKHHQKST